MVITLLALLVLLVVAGWVVAFSSVFAVRQVEVAGVRTLNSNEVQAAARIPLGTPLARQDLDAIADRIATLPPVRSVQVRRSWPRTVTVQVEERTAVLAVREPNGFTLVDDQGAAYLQVAEVPRHVAVAGVDPTNRRLLAEVGVVAAALPDTLRSKVSSIDAYTADGIRLRLRDGDLAFWGSSAESPLKAQVLAALLKRSATQYDVSSPHNPALR